MILRRNEGRCLRFAAFALAAMAAAVGFSGAGQAQDSRTVFVRAEAALDEPRGLCIDIPGHRDGVRVNAALVVHTCKRGIWNLDERFDARALTAGRLLMPEYDLCVAAAEVRAGSTLVLADCGGDPARRWEFDAGRLALAADPGLCITIGPEPSELTPGGRRLPSRHVARSLALDACREAATDRQIWKLEAPAN